MTRHCLSDDTYNIDLTDDQVIELALAGKISKCDGIHSQAEDDDIIYHVEEGYKLDLSKIGTLIVKDTT